MHVFHLSFELLFVSNRVAGTVFNSTSKELANEVSRWDRDDEFPDKLECISVMNRATMIITFIC